MEENCIFCKIVKKEVPAHIVYEDEEFLAFLDIKPRNIGHTLVIPKKHYRWAYDIPNFGGYAEVAKKMAQAILKSLNAEWIMFLTFGWQVPHAHLHVIPRFKDDEGEELPGVKEHMVTDKGFKETAEKIRKGL